MYFFSMKRRLGNVTPAAVGAMGASIGLAAGFNLVTLMEFLFFLFDITFHLCFAKSMANKATEEEKFVAPAVWFTLALSRLQPVDHKLYIFVMDLT